MKEIALSGEALFLVCFLIQPSTFRQSNHLPDDCRKVKFLILYLLFNLTHISP